MPMARSRYVSLEATPYYHCIGRCVRRAFLWGKDSFSGRDFSHRKAWVVERLAELSEVFSMSVCAYAVMSNHYHVVLHVDRQGAEKMSATEVLLRWSRLFNLPYILDQFLQGHEQDAATRRVVNELVEQLRSRLSDISWFMRCLNESIARRANAEDQCTGRFWEGRFKSQAILDEAGLLACCAYVDLNPIRAGIADLPETSDYTSIQQRLRELDHGSMKSTLREERKPKPRTSPNEENAAFVPLHPFGNSLNVVPAQGLPCSARDYIELVDWAARIVRSDKKHAMSSRAPSILSRLGFSPEEFEKAVRAKAMTRGTVIAQADRLKAYAEHLNKRCVYGVALPCSV
jgi:REP element-mobilizing transposase RayT